MKKTKERMRAEQLIQRLIAMDARMSHTEVALVTQIGLIYPWQTNKLINLRVLFEAVIDGERVYKDDPYGFIGITACSDAEEAVTVRLWPLFDPETEDLGEGDREVAQFHLASVGSLRQG